MLLASPASAVLWRADLTNAPAMPTNELQHAGALLYTPIKFCGGSGTWLGGKWFLTARHAVDDWSAGSLTVHLPAFGGHYPVKAIHLPPNKSADIALLELAAFPTNQSSLTLSSCTNETGWHIWMAGFGNFGPAGKVQGFGSVHCGENVVDSVNDFTARFSFSKPPEAKPFEACPAMFDSGGSIFFERNGKLTLGGVIVRVTERTAPNYGAKARYTRISRQAEWLKKTAPELPWEEQ